MITIFKYKQIEKAYSHHGYKFFNKKPYDLNMFGIRMNVNDRSKDGFDDYIGCCWIDEFNQERLFVTNATTVPGVEQLINPSFKEAIKNGTAILKENQYRSAYKMGSHGVGNWKHTALLQVKPMEIYRDSDKDKILDFEKTTIGLYGINIHGASLINVLQNVGNYSAGCQVIQNPVHLLYFQFLWQMQSQNGNGDAFTYTLFNINDL